MIQCFQNKPKKIVSKATEALEVVKNLKKKNNKTKLWNKLIFYIHFSLINTCHKLRKIEKI